MKYSTGETGRIFVISMEDGDKLPYMLEKFAGDKKIKRGLCMLLGGVRSESKMVSGPSDEQARPINPIINKLAGAHEILGIGTLFPGSEGKTKLHMHASVGREKGSITGCIRPGIEIWQVGEIILIEIVKTTAKRLKNEDLGFEILQP